MRFIVIVLFVPILLIPTSAVTAQDGDSPDGWPIVERCIDGPTRRPDGWTFEGTILLTGYAGIHAVNDAWPTPRVVAQFDGLTLDGGAGLSPNRRWYARVAGEFSYSVTFNHYYYVEEIIVHSTADRNEFYRIPWKSYYSANSGFPQMYWVDDKELLYNRAEIGKNEGLLILNPFNGSVSPWDRQTDVVYGSVFGNFYSRRNTRQYPSLDLTRTLVSGPLYQHVHAVYNTFTDEILEEINLADQAYAIWMPDSTHFVAEVDADPDEDRELRQLALFNRDGTLIDVILTFESGFWLSATAETWSSNGHYLTFVSVNRTDYDDFTLYLADMQERQIINTCLQVGRGTAFSPNNTKLAVLAPGTGTKLVYVLDLESWALHPVANHIVENNDGAVIGWREQ